MSSAKIKKRARPDPHPQPAATLPKISVLLGRGNAYSSEERWDLALEQADQILALEPDHWDALSLKLRCLLFLRWAGEAVPTMRRMLDLKPNLQMHSDLLINMLYRGDSTPESVHEESRRWFSLYGAPLAKEIRPHANDRDPKRKLKVAYLSPDLYDHTIMKLLPAVLEHRDDEQFEVRFYSITTRQDQVSERVSSVARVIPLKPLAGEIAARVREDAIDILIDLAGHTMDANAYLAFALKPAPVQVSWMGVMSTTGMPTMDYYIGDANSPGPGTEHLFSETVYRLPRVSGSYRPTLAIEVAESPFFRNGFITFASFNNPHKITRDVVKMWSVILHLVPGSRMFFKFAGLEKPAVQERFRRWFREDGISLERIRFEGRSLALEYLRTWNEVDIALDPYPYNGGTTTLDALWVGVPVVTLAGRLAVSCTGLNILSAVGLPVARSAEQYIQAALFLAENIPKTPGMRKTVHDAMANSPLMDEKGLLRALDAAFRDMWLKWCRAA